MSIPKQSHHLLNKLSKPSQVASTLDWKKTHGATVLALNFHQDRVGIAVASHPSTGQPVVELEPLRFARKQYPHAIVQKECLERFSNIIDEYNVCGVVVSWPLQHDTGRMGAACGRVIYALEQLWEQATGNHLNHGSENKNDKKHLKDVLARPFCLWDSDHVVPKQRNDPSKRVDSFGRCASYGTDSHPKNDNTEVKEVEGEFSAEMDTSGRISSVTHVHRHHLPKYFASKERYHEDELSVVCGVWNDFCKEHWPELYATSFAEPDELATRKQPEALLQGDDVEQIQTFDTDRSSTAQAYGT